MDKVLARKLWAEAGKLLVLSVQLKRAWDAVDDSGFSVEPSAKVRDLPWQAIDCGWDIWEKAIGYVRTGAKDEGIQGWVGWWLWEDRCGERGMEAHLGKRKYVCKDQDAFLAFLKDLVAYSRRKA